MKFPNLVYRCPGTHQCKGGTFDYRQVLDEDQLVDAIKAGWYPTIEAAQDPSGFDVEEFLKQDQGPEYQEPEPSPSPDPHPEFKDLSREELELRAHELGIKFSKNIKDETLAERIIQALEQE